MSNSAIGLALLLLLPVLLAAPLITAARRTDQERRKLLIDGGTSEAEIYACELVDGGRILRYGYLVPNRRTPFESSFLVGHGREHLVVGTKVQVRYKPSVPGFHVVVTEGGSDAA